MLLAVGAIISSRVCNAFEEKENGGEIYVYIYRRKIYLDTI